MAHSSKIRLLHSLEGHQDRVWHCAWSPAGDYLATCSGDKTVLKDHDRTVRRVAFSPDGKLLATASFDSTTSVYELREGKFHLLQNLEGHENEVKGVAWDCSGTLLATCSRDKSVWFFTLESDLQLDCVSVGQSHTQDVKSVVWHPNRELLLSCSYDDTMKIWQDDDDDWVCTETIKGHSSTVWDASFEPLEGNFLASCSEDRSIIVWKLTNANAVPAHGDEVTRFVKFAEDKTSHTRTVYSVDWSHAKPTPYIATGSADDALRVFSVQNMEGDAEKAELKLEATETKAHGGDVNCVRWHPTKLMFASCGDDGVVRVWSFEP